MKLQYENYDNDYNPMGISWENHDQKILINYPYSITAVYSEPLEKAIIEAFEEGELHFYNLNGTLSYKKNIPELQEYKFRGLNANKGSNTGVSLLFHPSEPGSDNPWGDTEQYELTLDNDELLGKKTGIYR